MLRRFAFFIVMALGLAGAGMSAESAKAAVAQPGAAASVVAAAPSDGLASKTYYRRYYGGYYRPYRYYRPYPVYRPYPYYARPYGGCRWVSRRVWTDYGYRVVRRRVCY